MDKPSHRSLCQWISNEDKILTSHPTSTVFCLITLFQFSYDFTNVISEKDKTTYTLPKTYFYQTLFSIDSSETKTKLKLFYVISINVFFMKS